MTTIPVPLVDGDTFVIDHSSLEPFQTCPRLAEYTIARRLRPTGDRSALRFGGIMHKVLEARYRAATPMFEQTPSVALTMAAVAETEFATWSPSDPDDFRTYDRMLALIEAYGKEYPYESFDIVPFANGSAIEVPFALPLGKILLSDGRWIKILFTGKIDMIYRTSSYYIMDHKSASIATNMAEFELSHQFQGYTWAAETLLNHPIDGVCINRVVIRKPTRTGDAFSFDRRLIPTVRSRVDEWKTDILYIISDFLEMCLRGYLPKHTVWCVGKYGTCPFHRVCTLDDPAQRALFLASGEFETNTWSPLTT
jgi:hypothetical protein